MSSRINQHKTATSTTTTFNAPKVPGTSQYYQPQFPLDLIQPLHVKPSILSVIQPQNPRSLSFQHLDSTINNDSINPTLAAANTTDSTTALPAVSSLPESSNALQRVVSQAVQLGKEDASLGNFFLVNRQGVLLTKGFILKSDQIFSPAADPYAPSLNHTHPLDTHTLGAFSGHNMNIYGAPHFRSLSLPFSNLSVVSQPTVIGIRGVLNTLIHKHQLMYPKPTRQKGRGGAAGASGDASGGESSPGSNSIQSIITSSSNSSFDLNTPSQAPPPPQVKTKVVWVNVREEPLCYITHAGPFVLRKSTQPFANLSDFYAIGSRIALVEKRLKLDILTEVLQSRHGMLLVHIENAKGKIRPSWCAIDSIINLEHLVNEAGSSDDDDDDDDGDGDDEAETGLLSQINTLDLAQKSSQVHLSDLDLHGTSPTTPSELAAILNRNAETHNLSHLPTSEHLTTRPTPPQITTQSLLAEVATLQAEYTKLINDPEFAQNTDKQAKVTQLLQQMNEKIIQMTTSLAQAATVAVPQQQALVEQIPTQIDTITARTTPSSPRQPKTVLSTVVSRPVDIQTSGVLTMLDIFTSLRDNEGYNVELLRIPMTGNTVPRLGDIEALLELITLKLHENLETNFRQNHDFHRTTTTPTSTNEHSSDHNHHGQTTPQKFELLEFVFNCQNSTGRSSWCATVCALIQIFLHLMQIPQLTPPKRSNNPLKDLNENAAQSKDPQPTLLEIQNEPSHHQANRTVYAPKPLPFVAVGETVAVLKEGGRLQHLVNHLLVSTGTVNLYSRLYDTVLDTVSLETTRGSDTNKNGAGTTASPTDGNTNESSEGRIIDDEMQSVATSKQLKRYLLLLCIGGYLIHLSRLAHKSLVSKQNEIWQEEQKLTQKRLERAQKASRLANLDEDSTLVTSPLSSDDGINGIGQDGDNIIVETPNHSQTLSTFDFVKFFLHHLRSTSFSTWFFSQPHLSRLVSTATPETIPFFAYRSMVQLDQYLIRTHTLIDRKTAQIWSYLLQYRVTEGSLLKTYTTLRLEVTPLPQHTALLIDGFKYRGMTIGEIFDAVNWLPQFRQISQTSILLSGQPTLLGLTRLLHIALNESNGYLVYDRNSAVPPTSIEAAHQSQLAYIGTSTIQNNDSNQYSQQISFSTPHQVVGLPPSQNLTQLEGHSSPDYTSPEEYLTPSGSIECAKSTPASPVVHIGGGAAIDQKQYNPLLSDEIFFPKHPDDKDQNDVENLSLQISPNQDPPLAPLLNQYSKLSRASSISAMSAYNMMRSPNATTDQTVDNLGLGEEKPSALDEADKSGYDQDDDEKFSEDQDVIINTGDYNTETFGRRGYGGDAFGLSSDSDISTTSTNQFSVSEQRKRQQDELQKNRDHSRIEPAFHQQSKIIVINLREEPLCFVHGLPLALRYSTQFQKYSNSVLRNGNDENESILKDDVINEIARSNLLYRAIMTEFGGFGDDESPTSSNLLQGPKNDNTRNTVRFDHSTYALGANDSGDDIDSDSDHNDNDDNNKHKNISKTPSKTTRPTKQVRFPARTPQRADRLDRGGNGHPNKDEFASDEHHLPQTSERVIGPYGDEMKPHIFSRSQWPHHLTEFYKRQAQHKSGSSGFGIISQNASTPSSFPGQISSSHLQPSNNLEAQPQHHNLPLAPSDSHLGHSLEQNKNNNNGTDDTPSSIVPDHESFSTGALSRRYSNTNLSFAPVNPPGAFPLQFFGSQQLFFNAVSAPDIITLAEFFQGLSSVTMAHGNEISRESFVNHPGQRLSFLNSLLANSSGNSNPDDFGSSDRIRGADGAISRPSITSSSEHNPLGNFQSFTDSYRKQQQSLNFGPNQARSLKITNQFLLKNIPIGSVNAMKRFITKITHAANAPKTLPLVPTTSSNNNKNQAQKPSFTNHDDSNPIEYYRIPFQIRPDPMVDPEDGSFIPPEKATPALQKSRDKKSNKKTPSQKQKDKLQLSQHSSPQGDKLTTTAGSPGSPNPEDSSPPLSDADSQISSDTESSSDNDSQDDSGDDDEEQDESSDEEENEEERGYVHTLNPNHVANWAIVKSIEELLGVLMENLNNPRTVALPINFGSTDAPNQSNIFKNYSQYPGQNNAQLYNYTGQLGLNNISGQPHRGVQIPGRDYLDDGQPHHGSDNVDSNLLRVQHQQRESYFRYSQYSYTPELDHGLPMNTEQNQYFDNNNDGPDGQIKSPQNIHIHHSRQNKSTDFNTDIHGMPGGSSTLQVPVGPLDGESKDKMMLETDLDKEELLDPFSPLTPDTAFDTRQPLIPPHYSRRHTPTQSQQPEQQQLGTQFSPVSTENDNIQPNQSTPYQPQLDLFSLSPSREDEHLYWFLRDNAMGFTKKRETEPSHSSPNASQQSLPYSASGPHFAPNESSQHGSNFGTEINSPSNNPSNQHSIHEFDSMAQNPQNFNALAHLADRNIVVSDTQLVVNIPTVIFTSFTAGRRASIATSIALLVMVFNELLFVTEQTKKTARKNEHSFSSNVPTPITPSKTQLTTITDKITGKTGKKSQKPDSADESSLEEDETSRQFYFSRNSPYQEPRPTIDPFDSDHTIFTGGNSPYGQSRLFDTKPVNQRTSSILPMTPDGLTTRLRIPPSAYTHDSTPTGQNDRQFGLGGGAARASSPSTTDTESTTTITTGSGPLHISTSLTSLPPIPTSPPLDSMNKTTQEPPQPVSTLSYDITEVRGQHEVILSLSRVLQLTAPQRPIHITSYPINPMQNGQLAGSSTVSGLQSGMVSQTGSIRGDSAQPGQGEQSPMLQSRAQSGLYGSGPFFNSSSTPSQAHPLNSSRNVNSTSVYTNDKGQLGSMTPVLGAVEMVSINLGGLGNRSKPLVGNRGNGSGRASGESGFDDMASFSLGLSSHNVSQNNTSSGQLGSSALGGVGSGFHHSSRAVTNGTSTDLEPSTPIKNGGSNITNAPVHQNQFQLQLASGRGDQSQQQHYPTRQIGQHYYPSGTASPSIPQLSPAVSGPHNRSPSLFGTQLPQQQNPSGVTSFGAIIQPYDPLKTMTLKDLVDIIIDYANSADTIGTQTVTDGGDARSSSLFKHSSGSPVMSAKLTGPLPENKPHTHHNSLSTLPHNKVTNLRSLVLVYMAEYQKLKAAQATHDKDKSDSEKASQNPSPISHEQQLKNDQKGVLVAGSSGGSSAPTSQQIDQMMKENDARREIVLLQLSRSLACYALLFCLSAYLRDIMSSKFHYAQQHWFEYQYWLHHQQIVWGDQYAFYDYYSFPVPPQPISPYSNPESTLPRHNTKSKPTPTPASPSSPPPSRQQPARHYPTFSQWLAKHREVAKLLLDIFVNPQQTSKLVQSTLPPSVLASRKGEILTPQDILKADAFSAIINRRLGQVAPGVINFRLLANNVPTFGIKCAGFNVGGAGIPTIAGLLQLFRYLTSVGVDSSTMTLTTHAKREVAVTSYPIFEALDYLNDQSDQATDDSDQNLHNQITYVTKQQHPPVHILTKPAIDRLLNQPQHRRVALNFTSVLWLNLREEPVVYVAGSPFVLRLGSQPFQNLEQTGINSSKVLRMESKLRDEAQNEADINDNTLYVHDEDDSGDLVGKFLTTKIVLRNALSLAPPPPSDPQSLTSPTTGNAPQQLQKGDAPAVPRQSSTDSKALSNSQLQTPPSTTTITQSDSPDVSGKDSISSSTDGSQLPSPDILGNLVTSPEFTQDGPATLLEDAVPESGDVEHHQTQHSHQDLNQTFARRMSIEPLPASAHAPSLARRASLDNLMNINQPINLSTSPTQSSAQSDLPNVSQSPQSHTNLNDIDTQHVGQPSHRYKETVPLPSINHESPLQPQTRHAPEHLVLDFDHVPGSPLSPEPMLPRREIYWTEQQQQAYALVHSFTFSAPDQLFDTLPSIPLPPEAYIILNSLEDEIAWKKQMSVEHSDELTNGETCLETQHNLIFPDAGSRSPLPEEFAPSNIMSPLIPLNPVLEVSSIAERPTASLESGPGSKRQTEGLTPSGSSNNIVHLTTHPSMAFLPTLVTAASTNALSDISVETGLSPSIGSVSVEPNITQKHSNQPNHTPPYAPSTGSMTGGVGSSNHRGPHQKGYFKMVTDAPNNSFWLGPDTSDSDASTGSGHHGSGWYASDSDDTPDDDDDNDNDDNFASTKSNLTHRAANKGHFGSKHASVSQTPKNLGTSSVGQDLTKSDKIYHQKLQQTLKVATPGAKFLSGKGYRPTAHDVKHNHDRKTPVKDRSNQSDGHLARHLFTNKEVVEPFSLNVDQGNTFDEDIIVPSGLMSGGPSSRSLAALVASGAGGDSITPAHQEPLPPAGHGTVFAAPNLTPHKPAEEQKPLSHSQPQTQRAQEQQPPQQDKAAAPHPTSITLQPLQDIGTIQLTIPVTPAMTPRGQVNLWSPPMTPVAHVGQWLSNYQIGANLGHQISQPRISPSIPSLSTGPPSTIVPSLPPASTNQSLVGTRQQHQIITTIHPHTGQITTTATPFGPNNNPNQTPALSVLAPTAATGITGTSPENHSLLTCEEVWTWCIQRIYAEHALLKLPVPSISYCRTPVTDEQAPTPSTVNDIIHSICVAIIRCPLITIDFNPGTLETVVVHDPSQLLPSYGQWRRGNVFDVSDLIVMQNCQAARGRTTTSMILTTNIFDALYDVHYIYNRNYSYQTHHQVTEAKVMEKMQVYISLTRQWEEEQKRKGSSDSKDSAHKHLSFEEVAFQKKAADLGVIIPERSAEEEEEFERKKKFVEEGYLPSIRKLVTVLPHGELNKFRTDVLIDAAGDMQNLRTCLQTTLQLFVQTSLLFPTQAHVNQHRGKNYLIRYIVLLLCGTYLYQGGAVWYFHQVLQLHAKEGLLTTAKTQKVVPNAQTVFDRYNPSAQHPRDPILLANTNSQAALAKAHQQKAASHHHHHHITPQQTLTPPENTVHSSSEITPPVTPVGFSPLPISDGLHPPPLKGINTYGNHNKDTQINTTFHAWLNKFTSIRHLLHTVKFPDEE